MTYLLLIVATSAYSVFLISISRASLHTDPNLAAGIVNSLGAAIPIALFFIADSTKENAINFRGINWALLGAIGIAVFTMALAKLFSIGENIGFVTPLIYGLAIFCSTLISWAFFGAGTNKYQLAGLIMFVGSLCLLVYSKFYDKSV